MFVTYFLVLVKSDCWLLGSSELYLVALGVFLLLVKSAKGIDIARPRDAWELALTRPCKLKLALDLFDDLLLQREKIFVSDSVQLALAFLRDRVSMQVQEVSSWLRPSCCLNAGFAGLWHRSDLVETSVLNLCSLSFRDLSWLLHWRCFWRSIDLRLFRWSCWLLHGCLLELSWVSADQIFGLCPNLIKVSWSLPAHFGLLLLGLAAKNRIDRENGSPSLTVVKVRQRKFEFWHPLEILVANGRRLAQLLLELKFALNLCNLSQIIA